MDKTYRAMQISAPGILEMVERTVPQPAEHEVLIKVSACGVCGVDLRDCERKQTDISPPRVPGHEIIGTLVMKGAGVPARWLIGQRVGVGRLGGCCMECDQCRKGIFPLCENQSTVGVDIDGGYAEYVLIRHTGLIEIPEMLSSVDAAPILCAGIATFNALRNSGARAGDRVIVLGIGGLGHLALQFARNMGLEVIAAGRGKDKANDAIALGAHQYLDTQDDNAIVKLKRAGGADYLFSTITHSKAVNALLPLISAQGKLVLLGVGSEPVSIMPGWLVGGERTVAASFVGSPFETERALRFSDLFAIRPQTERFPLARANEALARLKAGEARYRLVLTVDDAAI